MSSVLKRVSVICAITAGLVLAVLACGGGGGGGDGGGDAANPTTPAITTGPSTPAALTNSTVGASGGKIEISDASSPLKGTSIEVPAGATAQQVAFTISHSNLTSVSGLPDGAALVGKMITIQATGSSEWNENRAFDVPVRVTFPYVAPDDPDADVAFYTVQPDGTLESVGVEDIDANARTISFYTRTFASTAFDPLAADPLAASPPPSGGRPLSRSTRDVASTPTPQDAEAELTRFVQAVTPNQLGKPGTILPTGFLPSRNGFYIPNRGSYIMTRGNCFGMSSFAKYYFKSSFGPALHGNYHDARNTEPWFDDAVAIELATRTQVSMLKPWRAYSQYETQAQPSARATIRSILGALFLTRQPAILALNAVVANAGAKQNNSGHAVLVYRADVTEAGAQLFIYDPNQPRVDSGDTVRIMYRRNIGFEPWQGRTSTGAPSKTFNFFRHVGFAVGLTDAQLYKLKTRADAGFVDSKWFPKIKLTSITGKNNHEVVLDTATGVAREESAGQHKYVTSDKMVVVKGTVKGPLVQNACCYKRGEVCTSCVVKDAIAFVGNERIPFGVNNDPGGDGSFTFELPLSQGDNEIAILAAKDEARSWAAYYGDIIKSTASQASMTVSLTWGASADLDLYVKEPDELAPGTKKGDTVYYRHRNGIDLFHPYLDADNTHGYGPEHYVADSLTKSLYTDGTESESLYGDYTVRVHYYADHSGASTPETAYYDLEWKYLAYCKDPCVDPESEGLWVTDRRSGYLATPSSAACCDIGNSGSSWSTTYQINYSKPDPSLVTVPAPPLVMRP